MKKHLLPCGLTLVLHLLLWLLLTGRSLPRAGPWQEPFTVIRCQLAEQPPTEAVWKQPSPVRGTDGAGAAVDKTPKPEPSMAETQVPISMSAPYMVARPRKMVHPNRPADPLTKLPPPVAGKRAAQSDEPHSPGHAAIVPGDHSKLSSGKEKGAEATAIATPPATSASAIANNDRVPSPPSAPISQRLETKPIYLHTPDPQYPSVAKRLGYQGIVELKVLVRQDGSVGELQVATSSTYPVLDSSALEAVQRWRFEPGTRDGAKEDMWINIPIHFTLK